MKIIKTKKIPWQKTKHIDSLVLKQIFIENGKIKGLTNFGKAVFKPGDTVEKHSHPTKYEIFYVTKGKAKFEVEGKEKVVSADEVVVIEPNEMHSQSNPFSESVEWIYFGIATDF